MKNIKYGLVILILAVIAIGIYYWVDYRHQHPTTNDAYLKANTLYISPEIDGRLTDVLVHSYQRVKKGDLLLRIDDRQQRLALQQAEAAIEQAQTQSQSVAAKQKVAEAQSDAATQEQHNAATENQRMQQLVKRNMISKEQSDNARFAYNEAAATAMAAQQTIRAAQADSDEIAIEIKAALLAKSQAELELSYTEVRAPVDGILGEVPTRIGQFVSSGQTLFPLVDSSHYWIDANFKETDLHVIKPGQMVSIDLDMYPNHTLTGTVESLSPASGTSFSLIPAQNATGNWVKVTQRFPVRIMLDQAPDALPLRIGSSATVTVDTTIKDTTTHMSQAQ
ncbi:MAG: HlyD family secretion protein [Neptunomonas phycophila]|uniref:HlyD family secretion protein n=1 Tax=Neptunomonas phycophila TaxID=1572645 RepID=UPI003B8B57D3